jgi:pimeloyl-ACP methyl ester carboxylesterase
MEAIAQSEEPASGSRRTVVILIHGIRTAAWWQSRVASIFSDELGATVIPLKYGYFDLFRFLCPFGFCRRGPIERLRKQLQGIRDNFGQARLVVFAHSYGSYALSRVLIENSRFTFDRVILCGSIVPEDFDWDRVQDQILTRNSDKRDAIINECGTHDVWPVVASSVSWGYGASGTFGFGVQNVRDRYHPSGHSAYFTTDFVRKYWVPAVAGLPIDFSPTDRDENTASPAWFGLLRFPLRFVLFAVIPALLLIGGYQAVNASRNGWCWSGTTRAENACVETAELKSRQEIKERFAKLSADANEVFGLKGGTLFPAMERYDQTPQKWANILSVVGTLQDKINTSLNEISNYNAHLWQDGDKYILITKDGKISIEAKYWNAFEKIKQQLQGRSTIFMEMASVTSPPERARVNQWYNDLKKLHSDLEQALHPIMAML